MFASLRYNLSEGCLHFYEKKNRFLLVAFLFHISVNLKRNKIAFSLTRYYDVHSVLIAILVDIVIEIRIPKNIYISFLSDAFHCVICVVHKRDLDLHHGQGQLIV